MNPVTRKVGPAVGTLTGLLASQVTLAILVDVPLGAAPPISPWERSSPSPPCR